MKKTGILVLSIVIWGCSSQETDEIPEEIQHLENLTVFSDERDAPYQIELEREQSFGDSDETLIGNLGDIAVDEQGRIFIADNQRMLVHVFEPDGRLVTQLGRGGRGPGEFDSINSLHVRNDRLYAFDPNRFMVHVFTLDTLADDQTVILAENRGEFQEMSRAFPLINELYVRYDDTYIAKFIAESYENVVAWKNYETKGLLYRLDINGKITSKKLMEFTNDTRTFIADDMGGVAAGWPVEPFFGNALTVLSRDNRFYQAGPDHFLIKVYSPNGAYQQAYYYPHEKILLTQESAVEAGVPDIYITYMTSMDLPQSWPVLTEMIIDHHDRIWIATTVDDMNVMEWWVLENTGEPFTKFEWPRDEPIEVVKNGYLYTRQTDDDTGLEQIVRYRIEWNGEVI